MAATPEPRAVIMIWLESRHFVVSWVWGKRKFVGGQGMDFQKLKEIARRL
jgi:hypothetical protein